jgi:hypothetical protein
MYDRINVSIALAASERALKQALSEVSEKDRLSSLSIDGLPVGKQMWELTSEIRKQNPALKFCAVKRYQWVGDRKVFQTLCAYIEGHEYVLGEVGYGDFRMRKHGDAKHEYMVASRKIDNVKLSGGSDQRHMARTASVKAAVKNAGKFLVPHTLEEVAEFSYSKFASDIAAQRNEAASAASSLISSCASRSVISAELTNLIRLGVQFVTPEFKAAAEKLLATQTEAEAARARKTGAYFVQFREYRGVVRANVLTFDTNVGDSIYSAGSPSASTQVLASDLPEDLQQRIAVLSMVDDGTSVPGIGTKVSATSFWLERELA